MCELQRIIVWVRERHAQLRKEPKTCELQRVILWVRVSHAQMRKEPIARELVSCEPFILSECAF